MSYPEQVITVIERLRSHGVWFQLSENAAPVTSCLDAANNRNRLGVKGIPLTDELKSLVGTVDSLPSDHIIMIHCRANHSFDEGLLASHFGGRFQPMNPERLEKELGSAYGLVNPFSGFDVPQITQVFDRLLLCRRQPPYTLMTNAGHRRWGVEFFVQDLIQTLPGASLGKLVREEERAPKAQKIGILTGNSPESGMLLWDRINQVVREDPRVMLLGDISLPRVSVESVPEMGLSMELEVRAREVEKVVVEGVRALCEGGASLVALACNTTQFFAQQCTEVCNDYGATFVSMVDCLERDLVKRDVRSFDLFGIGSVSNLEKWSAFSQLGAKFHISVPSPKTSIKINDLTVKVKKGAVGETERQQLRQLISQASVTDMVVVALTELSILLDSERKKHLPKKPFIDTLSLLAEELAGRHISQYLEIPATEHALKPTPILQSLPA
ncbi:MAG: hypothetical protein K0U98_09335 [Deltaproteobacteria bacterium]|nr:hypothetical protein [Deltaproteobacteria bacterium]